MARFFCFAVALLAFAATLSDACECGIEGSASRIYAGTKAQAHKYPWIAHVRSFKSRKLGTFSQCGGSLAGDRHIITAAHCVIKDGVAFPASSIDIFLGRVKAFSERSVALKVSKVWTDPAYNDQTLANDFAILTLTAPVKSSQTVSQVCLPTSEEGISNLMVAGWGTTNATSESSNDLLEVDVDLIPRAECNDMEANYLLNSNGIPISQKSQYKFPGIAESHLCALNQKTGGDACAGDSGGPIMHKGSNGRWYLMGVVSGAWQPCGISRDIPGLYSRITYYSNVIKQMIPNACWKNL